MSTFEQTLISRQRRKVIAGIAAISSQLFVPIASYASFKRPASIGREKMDVDRFVEDCVIANREPNAQAAVKEVLAKAVSTPGAVIAARGEPESSSHGTAPPPTDASRSVQDFASRPLLCIPQP